MPFNLISYFISDSKTDVLYHGTPFGVHYFNTNSAPMSTVESFFYPLLDFDGDGEFDGIDINKDGIINDKNTAGQLISTLDLGSNSGYSTISSRYEETITKCTGNYSACLMGQATETLSDEQIEINYSGDYTNAFMGLSRQIDLTNTDPTRPHLDEVSWDIANYTAENSCAISPNWFFQMKI